MNSAHRLLLRRHWLLLPVLLLVTVSVLHAQVPELSPAKKPETAAKKAATEKQAGPGNGAPPQPQSAPATPAPAGAADAEGPFGFYAGETRAQIIAAIGKGAIKAQNKDSLEVVAAPTSDPHFDTYTLILSPRAGLLKIVATGKDQSDDASGDKVHSEFAAVRADVTTVYGPATETFDFVKSASKYKAKNQFILALANSDRVLAAYWTKTTFPHGVNSISLDANALGSDTGYLSLEFEFNGYAAYITGK